MLGPLGMLVQPTSKDMASRANNPGIFRIVVVLLLAGLRRNLQPPVRAFFYVGIISFRVSAVVPIAGSLHLWLDLHDFLLLNVNGWCGGRHNSRGVPIRLRISVIGRVTIIRRVPDRRISIPASVAIRRWIIRRPAAIVAQAITQ
jgi:hypothetical protein